MQETVRCNVNVNAYNVGSRDAHILLINVVLVCYCVVLPFMFHDASNNMKYDTIFAVVLLYRLTGGRLPSDRGSAGNKFGVSHL